MSEKSARHMQRAFSRPLTRRQAVALGGGIATGTLAASSTWAAPRREGDVLRSVLGVEQLLVFAYQRVLTIRILSSGVAYVVASFLAHEQQHAATLRSQLARVGVAPPPAPASVAAADHGLDSHQVSGRLADLHSENDCLKLLVDLEMVAEGAYFLGLAKLSDPALQRIGAQIMAVEAQHDAVLSGLLHPGEVRKAVPGAFVEGKP